MKNRYHHEEELLSAFIHTDDALLTFRNVQPHSQYEDFVSVAGMCVCGCTAKNAFREGQVESVFCKTTSKSSARLFLRIPKELVPQPHLH